MAIRLLKKSWWVDFQFDVTRYRKRSPENTRQGAHAYELLLRPRLARGEKIDGLASGQNPSFEEFAWKWFEEYAVPNNKMGRPLNHSYLTYHLEVLCKRVGLRRITWHALRHMFASHLAIKG